jgi:hypothetical protein
MHRLVGRSRGVRCVSIHRVSCLCPRRLTILPGTVLVLFHVEIDDAAAVLALHPRRFVDGLAAATALLGFAGLQREEDHLEELLPWSGNV